MIYNPSLSIPKNFTSNKKFTKKFSTKTKRFLQLHLNKNKPFTLELEMTKKKSNFSLKATNSASTTFHS